MPFSTLAEMQDPRFKSLRPRTSSESTFGLFVSYTFSFGFAISNSPGRQLRLHRRSPVGLVGLILNYYRDWPKLLHSSDVSWDGTALKQRIG